MKMYVLGTANGNYHEQCYNTCFCLQNNNQILLVDGGGGNQILGRLVRVGVKLSDIHDIFISHSHPDHIIGIVWVLKKISSAIRKGKYQGDCRVYANSKTISAIKTIRDLVFNPNNILDQIKFLTVQEGEVRKICDMSVEFFDTQASKEKQFGLIINNQHFVFCGDEPLHKINFPKVNHCDWFFHNAFCLDCDAEKYQVHKLCHSTVGEAAQIAQQIHANNLILCHTETDTLATRKDNYTHNARQYYHGNIFVPDDLEIINLDKK